MWPLHHSSASFIAPRGDQSDQSRLRGALAPGVPALQRAPRSLCSLHSSAAVEEKNRFSITNIQDLVISSRARHTDSCTSPQKGGAKGATFCVASATVQLGTELTLTTPTVQPGETFLGPGRFEQLVLHRVGPWWRRDARPGLNHGRSAGPNTCFRPNLVMRIVITAAAGVTSGSLRDT